MRLRCNSETEAGWCDYGKRGIKVCEEWDKDFLNFYNWAMENGYSDDLTIERINVNGNYEPSNCEWILFEDQAHNKRNTIKINCDGKVIPLYKLTELYGIPRHTLYRRYYRAKSKGKDITLKKLIEPIRTNYTALRYRKK